MHKLYVAVTRRRMVCETLVEFVIIPSKCFLFIAVFQLLRSGLRHESLPARHRLQLLTLLERQQLHQLALFNTGLLDYCNAVLYRTSRCDIDCLRKSFVPQPTSASYTVTD